MTNLNPTALVLHCSAGSNGDAKYIDWMHRTERNFSEIGYHAVILNGVRLHGEPYRLKLDGKIEPGRSETKVGAHCAAGGMNFKSLGCCLIGHPGSPSYPTKRQLAAAIHWCYVKCKQYGIPPEEIYQHSDWDPRKPLCASLDIELIRKKVRQKLGAG